MNIFNRDFRDFLEALNKHNVEYLLVGGYAVILHGYMRSTGDMDIWVNPTRENYVKLILAFRYFGLPEEAISEEQFLDTDRYDVFTFGISPTAIDLMTKVKGLEFEQSYQNSEIKETQGIDIPLLSYEALIQTKKSAGRLKDQADIEYLEQE